MSEWKEVLAKNLRHWGQKGRLITSADLLEWADELDPPKPKPEFKPGDVVADGVGDIRIVISDIRVVVLSGEIDLRSLKGGHGWHIATKEERIAYCQKWYGWADSALCRLAAKAYGAPCT